MTDIKFEETGRILLEGVDTVVDAVKVTYGPRGRSIVFNKNKIWPTVSSDTSSILQYIDLNDDYLGNAAAFVSETCIKTTNQTGSGATTTAILMQAMLHEGMKNVSAGANPMIMRNAIQDAADIACKEIMKNALQIGGEKEMKLVARIAAGDEELGDLVAEGMMKTGDYGIIAVDESKVAETYVDYVSGMQIDRVYISSYMINNPATGEAVLENPFILMTDRELSDFDELIPILEMVHKAGGELAIVCKDLKDGALAGINHNIRRGVIKTVAVKAFGTGERVLEYLEDLAIVTGGEVISETFGRTLKDLKLSQLGRADKFTASNDRTVINGGKGAPENIRARAEEVAQKQMNAVDKFEHDRNRDRLAKLTGGISRIRIGGYTQTEVLERKQRAEDALAALSAAVSAGVVPGGGVAFLDVIAPIAKLYKESTDSDYKTGVKTVLDALSAPIKQLAENVGLDGPAVLHNVMEVDEMGYGFNAETCEYGNMMDMGIADPALAACAALTNASHAVALMLTSNAFVQKLDV